MSAGAGSATGLSGSLRRSLGALLVGLLVLTGCASTIDSASVETFVITNRYDALPRAEVLLGGTDDAARLRVTAVVADTPDARSRGLMGVESMPDGVGMLFVFTEPSSAGGRPGFWMLDTLMPLDIVFAADGIVIGVATMRPCPGPPCPITHPGVEYDVALEVAAGVLGAAGIVVGDRFVWRVTEGAG